MCMTSRGVRRKLGGQPFYFPEETRQGTPSNFIFAVVLHYILENYTREPPITQEGVITVFAGLNPVNIICPCLQAYRLRRITYTETVLGLLCCP